MDHVKRHALVRKVQTLMLSEDPGRDSPLPVVSLEDFFEGNDDFGSIGCNLLEREHPGPAGFFSVLEEIRNRPEVQDVLIEILEADEDDQWPFSERVYILARASLSDVSQWLEPLFASEVDEGIPWKCPSAAFPALMPGFVVYAAWWD